MSSGASNLGPTSQELLSLVEERRLEAAEENGVDPDQIPPEALTSSGSGLDPHISPEYAALQVDRVAELVASTPTRFAAWWTRTRRVGCSASWVSPE